jgi:hypothetical protein
MSKSNKKNRNSKSLPTQVELFQGHRSQVAFSAIFRNGAGSHGDKRDRKARKGEWKGEDWG